MTTDWRALADRPLPLPAGDPFPTAALHRWLRARLPELPDVLPRVGRFPLGASNLTYELAYPRPDGSGQRVLVLRRPPPGDRAASAHDMGREVKVLAALGAPDETGQPRFPWVPRMRLRADEQAPLGCDFYVMEQLPGVILRRDLPASMGLDADATGALCQRAWARLAALHALPVEGPLAGLGRGSGYVARQVGGWSRRARRIAHPEGPDLEPVMAWLEAHRPADVATCVIHNDYRFDNLVLRPDEADVWQVVGVLDWEMCTLGDPLCDLGCALAYWAQADDEPAFRATLRQPSDAPGMWTRAQVVRWYAQARGPALGLDPAAVVAGFGWYEVFGLFRLAVILLQIHHRYRLGQTRDPRFASFEDEARMLRERCLRAMTG